MTETFDVFELGQWVDKSYPSDRWPEANKAVADKAVARLLEKYPDAKIIEDRSECWGDTHERFAPLRDLKFILVRTVKLDRRVDDA